MECSARTCEGVREIFDEAARIMVRKDYKGPNGMFIGSKLHLAHTNARTISNGESYMHTHTNIGCTNTIQTYTLAHTHEGVREIFDESYYGWTAHARDEFSRKQFDIKSPNGLEVRDIHKSMHKVTYTHTLIYSTIHNTNILLPSPAVSLLLQVPL